MTLAAAIHARLATAKTECVVAGGLRLAVARVKITETRDRSRRCHYDIELDMVDMALCIEA
jgi:hypothetical protein